MSGAIASCGDDDDDNADDMDYSYWNHIRWTVEAGWVTECKWKSRAKNRNRRVVQYKPSYKSERSYISQCPDSEKGMVTA